MKFISFIKFIIHTIVFLLFYVFILIAIVLISAGVLAIPVSLSAMSGLFSGVVSDLSPPAMLLTGISCISAGLAITLAVVILFPKQVNMFKRR